MTLEEAIEKNKEELLNSIKTLVAIPSVYAQGAKEKPVGDAIDKALNVALEMAKSFGCTVAKKDTDGLYVYAQWGEGAEMLGILAHVDVVPAENTNRWSTPPFEATEKDGKLYGRGTADDKGPLLASMIALKSLQDIGFKPKKRIRFIIGGDEETGMRCMESYKRKEEIPTIAFTPDGSFPLIYGEKGIIHIQATSRKFHGIITAGSARNAVAGEATYEGSDYETIHAIAQRMGASVHKEKGKLTIDGVSTHAKDPEKGNSALITLAQALYASGDKSPIPYFISEILGTTHNGEKILGTVSDKESGSLTITPSMVRTTQEEIILTMDIRVPVTINVDHIKEKLVQAMENYGLQTKILESKPALYAPLDTQLVQGLLKAYQDVTKDTISKPTTTGGGTYARMFHDRCVAFGMVFPKEEATFHQDDEHISIKRLMEATHIYALAIQNLAG